MQRKYFSRRLDNKQEYYSSIQYKLGSSNAFHTALAKIMSFRLTACAKIHLQRPNIEVAQLSHQPFSKIHLYLLAFLFLYVLLLHSTLFYIHISRLLTFSVLSSKIKLIVRQMRTISRRLLQVMHENLWADQLWSSTTVLFSWMEFVHSKPPILTRSQSSMASSSIVSSMIVSSTTCVLIELEAAPPSSRWKALQRWR